MVDVEYVGQHGYNIVESIGLNNVDFGVGVPAAESRTRRSPRRLPAPPRCRPIRCAAFRGYSAITQNVSRGWVTHHSLQISFNRRFTHGAVVRLQRHDRALERRAARRARLQHNADGTVTYRDDQAQADDLFQTPPIAPHDEGATSCGICRT